MDRELIIRLGASIERQRAQIRDEELALQKKRDQLIEMEQRLDSILKTQANSGGLTAILDTGLSAPGQSLSTRIAEYKTGGVHATVLIGGSTEPSITRLVKRFFELNPSGTFTASDVMAAYNFRKDKDGAVRQALKRLFDDAVLMRERDGAYHLNPLRVEANTGG